jgi:nucleoid DNA-binding protein
LNSLTEVVVGTLKTEKRVALKGLGFFELRFKRAREARNPRTQEVWPQL